MKVKYFLVFGVIVLVLIGVLVLQASGRLSIGSLLGLSGGKMTIITSDAIIDKIEQVSELTTTKYTIQLVVRGEFLGTFLGSGDIKMLLVAKGTVKAGLDMAKLDASAVSVSEDGKSVTVNLPPVKIFDRDHILSSNKQDTYVYDVKAGIAAQTGGMETGLRAEANKQILEAACKDGIMEQASRDAKVAIEQLLLAFVPNVTVLSAPVPSVEECKAAK